MTGTRSPRNAGQRLRDCCCLQTDKDSCSSSERAASPPPLPSTPRHAHTERSGFREPSALQVADCGQQVGMPRPPRTADGTAGSSTQASSSAPCVLGDKCDGIGSPAAADGCPPTAAVAPAAEAAVAPIAAPGTGVAAADADGEAAASSATPSSAGSFDNTAARGAAVQAGRVSGPMRQLDASQLLAAFSQLQQEFELLKSMAATEVSEVREDVRDLMLQMQDQQQELLELRNFKDQVQHALSCVNRY